MKVLIVAFAITIISCRDDRQKNTIQVSTNDTGYFVYKIDSINSYNIVYAKKDGRHYKIISSKDSSDNSNLIKKGKCYNFHPISYLFYSGENKWLPVYALHIRCMNFDDSTQICLKDSIKDLSYDKNIKGLSFLNNKK